MPDPIQELTFLSWSRERIGELVTGVAHGRARGQTTVTLSGATADGVATSSGTRTLAFLLAGPADVVGLQPVAISGRHPAPGALDHESDRCPHAELRDPALPWRYTPAANPGAGGHLHPWIVLVVGIEGEEITMVGDRVTLSPAVQAAHPVGGPGTYPWAHVQVDAEGRRVARVLSGRPLEAGTDYVAVVVPAFLADGSPAWAGVAPVTLPVYDHWVFRTATPPGSFEDLAGRLRPGAADPSTGRAPVDYPREPEAGDLEVRGALVALGQNDGPLPQTVADDLAALRTPARDDAGRPIVGLPRYGDAWHTDPDVTTWGAALNGDPRHRGVAGLGLEVGIRFQDELAAEASAAAGALGEARQRIAHLGIGLAAARSLWQRRLPDNPLRRLWVLGPALGRVVTERGPLAELATADGRALPRGIFSSAARRVLRPGPARTATSDGGVDPAVVLVGANRPPDPPEPSDDGIAVDVPVEELDERRHAVVESGEAPLDVLVEQAREMADRTNVRLRELAHAVVVRLVEAADRREPAPWMTALDLLAEAAAVDDNDEQGINRLHEALGSLVHSWLEYPRTDPDGFVEVVADFDEPRPVEPPCVPVDLGGLADGALPTFDPRGESAPVVVRVLSTIDGIDPEQPLAPPEVCFGLDRPVWQDLARAVPEWLLPGVAELPPDAVIAVETNPVFVDAFLTGLNTQLLAELRWRNIPVATGCTPLRVFWDRADTGAGDRVDDVRGLHAWLEETRLGDPQHRPPGAAGRDLVVVIRGELFRRYPATLVYLVSAVYGTDPDFEADPPADAPRVFPSFQGRIGPDVTFFGFQGFAPEQITRHWLVFEEPPAGYRFANDVVVAPSGLDGATFAQQAFANPVRVLIRGDALDAEAPPPSSMAEP